MTKLSQYLKDNKISQVAFAKRVGIAPYQLSRLVNGRSGISLLSAKRIEDATNGAVPMASWVPDQAGAK